MCLRAKAPSRCPSRWVNCFDCIVAVWSAATGEAAAATAAELPHQPEQHVPHCRQHRWSRERRRGRGGFTLMRTKWIIRFLFWTFLLSGDGRGAHHGVSTTWVSCVKLRVGHHFVVVVFVASLETSYFMSSALLNFIFRHVVYLFM